jgi:excisionase family DNA binding protein
MREIEQDTYYSVREAISRLKISRSTLWRWIRDGRLRAYRVGPRSIRIRQLDIERLLRPAHPPRKEMTPMDVGERPIYNSLADIPPLTDEEVRRGLEALERSGRLIEKMRQGRGGRPFSSSVEIIREMREERSRQLEQM